MSILEIGLKQAQLNRIAQIQKGFGLQKANEESASRAIEAGIPNPEAAGEEKWITVRGKHMLINTKTGDIKRGGSGIRTKEGEKVKKMTREGGTKEGEKRKFDKYGKNLKQVGNKIYSYGTHVATVEGGKLKVVPGYESYSKTTSKHINYAASELGLEKVTKNK